MSITWYLSLSTGDDEGSTPRGDGAGESDAGGTHAANSATDQRQELNTVLSLKSMVPLTADHEMLTKHDDQIGRDCSLSTIVSAVPDVTTPNDAGSAQDWSRTPSGGEWPRDLSVIEVKVVEPERPSSVVPVDKSLASSNNTSDKCTNPGYAVAPKDERSRKVS